MMRRQIAIFIAVIVFLLAPIFASGTPQANARGSYLVYVGTYTGPTSKGIYAYRFNAATGQSTSLGLVAETSNPSFLAIDRTRRFLYAVNEISDYQGQKSGGVSAFAIDRKTGKLTFLNEVPSRGTDPCYVTLDKSGEYVLVANYGGGNVAAFPILNEGRLGEAAAFIQHTGRGHDPERQEGPHAHEIELANDNRFAIAADLGLDELLIYHFDPAHGTLSPSNPPFAKVQPGSGPRHFAFHPNGKYVYVINEMGSTVTAFSYDAHGTLKEQQTISTLPQDFKGKNDTAEIEVHPKGKFLYGSNRGHDSIAVFAIGPKGMLKAVEYVSTEGKMPRSFAIDPTGSYLFAANQGSNKIVVFRIDSKTGHLRPTGEALEAPAPVCIKFMAID
jgi:6-phosphogluconolactonase